ncbi:hypothetical protein AB1N83_011036 [Pleurotus pulmonarius]
MSLAVTRLQPGMPQQWRPTRRSECRTAEEVFVGQLGGEAAQEGIGTCVRWREGEMALGRGILDPLRLVAELFDSPTPPTSEPVRGTGEKPSPGCCSLRPPR